jgi:AAA15 family ATPase/GTPase
MLLQFSITNFRTFREKATLSLIASNYDKGTRENENITLDKQFQLRVLKSAVVYGANASGKSKLFEALMFMKHFVISSSKYSQKGDQIDVEPFRLNEESEKLPTEFEVVFIYKNTMFRYGFEVDKTNVIAEWLYYKPKTKEIELFYREGNRFETHDRNFTKGKTVIKEGLVRDNALLLSVSAQFNDATSIAVIDWFKKLKIISGLYEFGYQGFTMGRTADPVHKARILDLLKAADLGIQDINLEKMEIDKLPKELPKELRDKIILEVNEEKAEFISDVITTHKKYDSNKSPVDMVNFSLDVDESSGTRKFFALAGPILDVIENGYTLVIDELDSKLHANLIEKIVSLFNSVELNKKNAQLIFNSHDTHLLGTGLMRRDQIWFTEKNILGEAKLYSLADFKSDTVRKTESFENNYLRGKYGAVPFLGFFDDLTNKLPQYEVEGQKS